MKTWWPMFVGGLAGPIVALGLSQWMPRYWAVGLAFTMCWFLVGLLFVRRPPTPGWRFGRWMAGGVAGAVIAGVLARWF